MVRFPRFLLVLVMVFASACAGTSSSAGLEANKALVRQWVQEVDAANGSMAVIDKWMAPDFKVSLNGGPPMDRAAYKDMLSGVVKAFSNLRHEILYLVAEGDNVSLGMKITATHSGEYMGVAGTGRQISIVESVLVRIAGGRIADEQAVVDLDSLRQQISAPPAAK